MVGNIILCFSTLAAAFRLKAPLPPYLPPVEESRLRLVCAHHTVVILWEHQLKSYCKVEAIRKLDVVKNRDVNASRQLLYFAYALTMKGVTMELGSLGRRMQDAFGVIGQSPEEFEMLFSPLWERQIDYLGIWFSHSQWLFTILQFYEINFVTPPDSLENQLSRSHLCAW